jgi:hypothetical protein
MDELLRAYAKMRREQAGPPSDLHPATRKLLQDEVRRTFGTPPAPSNPIGLGAWLAARWRLVATGGAAAVLFVVVTVLNAPSWNRSFVPHPSVVSAPVTQSGSPAANRSETAAAPEAAGTVSAASPTPSAESSVATTKPPATETDRIELPLVVSGALPANRPETAAAPVPVETPAPAGPAPSAQPSLGPLAAPASAAGTIAPPSVAAPLAERGIYRGAAPATAEEKQADTAAAAPAMALPSEAIGGAGASTQNFVQVNTRTRTRALQPPLSNILSAFQMERAGANVRIVDADGSVYEGQVLGRPAPGGGGGVGAARGVAAKALKDAKANSSWAFKVSGTNKNLQQNVVFIGNVLNMPEAMSAPAARHADVALEDADRKANVPQAHSATFGARRQPAQNPFITGKVQVGAGKEFKIEAKPPAP